MDIYCGETSLTLQPRKIRPTANTQDNNSSRSDDWIEGLDMNQTFDTPHANYIVRLLDPVREDLAEIAEYEEGWDNEDAPPIGRTLITCAQSFVLHLREKLAVQPNASVVVPDVYATREGSIEFYWAKLNYQFSITFLHSGEIQSRTNTPTMRKTENISLEEAQKWALTALKSK